MITRRGLLAGGAALIPNVGKAIPPDHRFTVLRNDSEIGQHVVTFHQDGDTLLATVAVDIAVRLGPIVLFRYSLSVRETWRGGQFASLESTANDDGKPYQVHAARSGDQVVVEAAGSPRQMLSAAAIPLTHWNILCMERPLFNPQDGVVVQSTVVAHGDEMLPLANGGTLRAAHYSLVGKVNLDDWYDPAHQWAALRSTGTDGSRIEYRRAL